MISKAVHPAGAPLIHLFSIDSCLSAHILRSGAEFLEPLHWRGA